MAKLTTSSQGAEDQERRPAATAGELSDAELESVSGGGLGFVQANATAAVGLLLPAIQKVR
jgi:hypothetical protein